MANTRNYSETRILAMILPRYLYRLQLKDFGSELKFIKKNGRKVRNFYANQINESFVSRILKEFDFHLCKLSTFENYTPLHCVHISTIPTYMYSVV